MPNRSSRLTRRAFVGHGVFATAALALGVPLIAPTRSWGSAKVGEAAPDFSLPTTSGGSQRLADLRGKIVVLEWTNHECPYVRKHYDTGNMQELQKEMTGQGVTWLTLISSAPGEQGHVTNAQANDLTASRKAAPTAVLIDAKGTAGRAYGATNTPHMYVVDRAGVLAYAGAIDDKPTTRKSDVPGAQNYVRAAVQAVAAGQAVKTPVTRAYGCTVKYS